jgi:hypothetical protein
MKLPPGALDGNSAIWVSVDPMAQPVTHIWLVANNGTLWRMDTAGNVSHVDAPGNFRVVADVDPIGLLAIDREDHLWSLSSGSWTLRANPDGPADPFVSATGDGSGRAWLATRDGRVFSTNDGGASFSPDSSGFGPGADRPQALKAYFTHRPSDTLWYLDTERRIWQRGGVGGPGSLSKYPHVGDGLVHDISVADGLIWVIMPRPGGVGASTTDGVSSLESTAMSNDIFTVAAGINRSAWAVKSDGSLWEFVEV